MGNLFSRGQQISEIKSLRYAELKEWNGWHELMLESESTQTCQSCGRKYDVRKHKKCPCGKG